MQQSYGEESHHRRSHHNRSHHSRSSKAKDKEIKVDEDVQDLKEKYEKMAFFIENGERRSTAENLMSKTNLPFTNQVMRFPFPNKFKALWVDRYNRSEDPSDHMEGFRAHLALHGTLDEIACQAFPVTLKGVTKEWFGNLSPKSIDNFDTLGRQFLSQFLVVRRRKKNSAYLFNWEKLTVERLDEQMILSALTNRIRIEGPLMVELARRPMLGTLR
jgi:hypothetical protein